MAFDNVRITFLDKCGESLERVSFGFLNVVWIDNNQFFPAAVVRESDAHEMIVPAGVTAPGYRKHFQLHSLQFFKWKIFEQCPACGREVVLHRIGESEEIAPGILQSVAQGD